ncbi:nitrilase-related carbon-nitrogen hydrolase [Nocardia sp. CDC153]|uniref:nitrilase-related carbon-nitrogen hydrolase n=1 Tax=Nocardia sp. CDC153 TaxID=3112167 RepID=UPI002DBB8719|nr:nitrilase-related carbon-nitrogen hydrolase [Nocardia sp. CDC153]MEC3957747.1 nitrilase-related carbon-nitrogen hydrolase [Nocardia sp. CDC153]
MTRVAAAQFAVGTDVAVNLETCLRMIDDAAAAGAELLVLPEFCNHLSWYTDRSHAREMACRLEGSFLTAIAERAARHRLYLKIGVTLARADGRVTATGLLYGPDGRLLGESDKQILMGAENDHLDRGDTDSEVIETPLGRIGMYACMEGVICEVPRSLAVRGAHVLLNSLNSFAIDEASLHIPVRAAENKVWVVAANKVGPLLPQDQLPTIAATLGVPADRLHGAGESQIVAPDGTVVAKAPPSGDAVVMADIDLRRAEDKHRPDGTDLFAARRPRVYTPLLAPSRATRTTTAVRTQRVAVTLPDLDRIAESAAAGAGLIVVPECLAKPLAVTAVAAALRGTSAHAVVTVRSGDSHVGLLVDGTGVRGRQPQLHRTRRHPWLTELGSRLEVFETPWARLALVVGDDALFPETFRLAAVADADVVAVAHTPAEPWEYRLGLPERAAENRLNIVAAGLDSSGELTAAVYALSPDFTLWTPWQGPFAGVISHPEVISAPPGADHLFATVRPAQAVNRRVSRGTDLVADRPAAATAALTRESVTATTEPELP